MQAAKDLQLIFGNLEKTGATCIAYSLTNEDVILSIAGQLLTISMTATGADRGTNDASGSQVLGYTGSKIVTDLPVFTGQNWSATQAAKSDSGYFRTSGEMTDNFALGFVTCMNSGTNDPVYLDLNGWQFIEHYIKTRIEFPLLSVIHIDDIIYADGGLSSAVYPDTCNQNKTTLGTAGARTEYDFSLWYFSWAGLLDGFTAGSLNTGLTDSWHYVKNNTTIMLQVGDHEFGNNFWLTDYTVVPNRLHKTANGFDGIAMAAWNNCCAALAGTMVKDNGGLDTEALHWYKDFGNIRVIAGDPIISAVNTVSHFGNNQIDDILNLADTPLAHKVLCTPAGLSRAIDDGLTQDVDYKAENFIRAEYDRLYVNTGQTPKSLMDNPKTNGLSGNVGVVRGDYHSGAIYHYTDPVSAGKAAENFTEVSLRSVTNSGGTANPIYTTSKLAQMAGINMEVIGGVYKVGTTDADDQEHGSNVLIIEHVGNGALPEVWYKYWSVQKDAAGTFDNTNAVQGNVFETMTDSKGITWQCSYMRKFVQYGDNRGYTEVEVPPYSPPITSGSDSGF